MNIEVTKEALEELEKVSNSRENMKDLRIYIAAYG